MHFFYNVQYMENKAVPMFQLKGERGERREGRENEVGEEGMKRGRSRTGKEGTRKKSKAGRK